LEERRDTMKALCYMWRELGFVALKPVRMPSLPPAADGDPLDEEEPEI
jgi:hypothetical protein